MTPKNNNADPRRPIRRMVNRKKIHARAANREDMEEFENEAEPGMKLSQAFLVVLLLHILAVGGIYVFNEIKSATKAEPVAKTPSEAPAEPIAKPAPLAEEPASSASTAPTTSASTTSSLTHTVAAGDTLHRIAGKYGMSVGAIEKANNLENNAIIRVGQVLSIPKAGDSPAEQAKPAKPAPAVVAKAPPVVPVAEKTAKPAPADAAEKSAPAASSEKTYTVAKGDNPYSIAKKLKVNPIELMKANKIDDPKKLQIGQKLVLP